MQTHKTTPQAYITIRTRAYVALTIILTMVAELMPMQVHAVSSWNPTLIVNTESFQEIDVGDGTTSVDLRFGGSTSTLKLLSSGSFQFNKSLSVIGNISGSTLTIDHNANIREKLTVGSLNQNTSGATLVVERSSFTGAVNTGTNATLFSVDQMAFGQLEGGAYFGRVGLKENQWGVTNYANTWSTRESDRNWRAIAMSSDGKIQTAIVNAGKIYISSDYGNTWDARDSDRGWFSVAMSSDGKFQTAVEFGGQIYISSDYGNTWSAVESNRSWYFVAMSSDGKTQTAVVNSGQIYVSTDYGNTWIPRESARNWRGIAMSSDGKIQTVVEFGGQIYISSDYGNTWSIRENTRNWRAIAMSSNGKIQTAVDYGGQIYTSTNYGNTWTATASSIDWIAIAMSSDGKIQTAVTFGFQVHVSTDYGNTWTAKDSSRNWRSVAMSSDGKTQTALDSTGKIYVSYADSSVFGNVIIGSGSSKGDAFSVVGSISGSRLTISENANISGSLLVKNSVTTQGSFSGSSFFGSGLGDCNNSTTSKLIYNSSTGKFSCATDQTGGSSGGLGFADAQGIFVRKSGDSMTGSLRIRSTSGTTVPNLSVYGGMSGYFLRTSGAADIHGPLSVSGSLRADGDFTINDDRTTSADAVLTFGNSTTNQTLKYIHSLQKFQFSANLNVIGSISGKTLTISGNGSTTGSIVLQNGGMSISKLSMNPSGTKATLFSVDQMALGQNEGGAYFGRVGLKENQWGTSEYWVISIARESNRNWNAVAVNSDGKVQTAIVYNGQIYTSTDYGVTWTARDSSRSWYGIAMSSDGKVQTATAYNGQIYTSTDYGVTWTARDSSRTWHGISMSSDGKIQAASTNGGQIYTSTDYGVTWTPHDSNRSWYGISMSSDGKVQTAVVYSGQIYTSTDYGVTWAARDSSRAWLNIAMSSDGKVQTATTNTTAQIYTSTDYGVTWTARDSNRTWYGIAMSSDGKIQSATVDTGQIYTSTDYGVTWTARDSSRSWYGIAMSSDGKVQTALDNFGQIYTSYATSTIVGSVVIGTGSSKGNALNVVGAISGSRVTISNNANISGSLLVNTSIATNGSLTINNDADSNDAVLTFGNTTANQTIKYLNSGQKFQFSKDLSVIGNISGSTLRVDGNASVNGALSLSGATFMRTIADPAAPGASRFATFASDVAGRAMLSGRGPEGGAYAYQPALFQKFVMMLQAGGGTTVNGIGTTVTNDTTISHPTPTETFGYMTNMATAATLNDTAGTSSVNTTFIRGSTAGANGFFYRARIGVVDTASVRVFSGLANQTIATMVGNDNPAGHFVGFQFSTNRSDTNWMITTKDGTTQTATSTGIAFTANKVYDLTFFCSQQCTSITWRVDNITDSTNATGTISTNLPGTSTAMRIVQGVSALTATAKSLRMQFAYTESDR